MKILQVAPLVFFVTTLAAQTPGEKVWNELKSKRESLSSLHQEFEVTETQRSTYSAPSFKRQITLDVVGKKWREHSKSGSGLYIQLFDGTDRFTTDGSGLEYIRTKVNAKDVSPAPPVYRMRNPDWTKAAEIQRGSCGYAEMDRQCVVLEAPVKPSMTTGMEGVTRITGGKVRAIIDAETGIAISIQSVVVIEPGRGGSYSSESMIRMKSMQLGKPIDSMQRYSNCQLAE